jgi:RNA polymerase sigma-70 factor (ECF subfamily)
LEATVGPGSSSLLNCVLRGEAGAWNRFAEVYVPLVFRWTRGAGLNEVDASDVCQNVFLTVVKDLPKFRRDEPGHSLQGWLRTITRHAVVNHFRQKEKQVGQPGYDVQLLEAAWSAGASQQSLHEDQQLLLARAVEVVRRDFEPATWEMFWQLEMEGQTAQEIAAARSVSVWSVYKSRSRVLARLRDLLGDWPLNAK